jgi:hypothetical protein
MGVASRVADYAQKPALHEGRGMVAGREVNVPPGIGFPGESAGRRKIDPKNREWAAVALMRASRPWANLNEWCQIPETEDIHPRCLDEGS